MELAPSMRAKEAPTQWWMPRPKRQMTAGDAAVQYHLIGAVVFGGVAVG